MKRDRNDVENNGRPVGTRVQHRTNSKRGAIIATPANQKISKDYFVLWDDSSTSQESPRNLAYEFVS